MKAMSIQLRMLCAAVIVAFCFSAQASESCIKMIGSDDHSGPQVLFDISPAFSHERMKELVRLLREQNRDHLKKLSEEDLLTAINATWKKFSLVRNGLVPMDQMLELYGLAAALLERNGIEYDLAHSGSEVFVIRPVKTLKQSLNNIAYNIFRQSGAHFIFAVQQVQDGVAGFFRIPDSTHKGAPAYLAADLNTFSQGRMMQTGLHETIHWKFYVLRIKNKPHPLSTQIKGFGEASKEILESILGYAEFMTIEEVVTHIHDLYWVAYEVENTPEYQKDLTRHPRFLKKVKRASDILEFTLTSVKKNQEELKALVSGDISSLYRQIETRIDSETGAESEKVLTYRSFDSGERGSLEIRLISPGLFEVEHSADVVLKHFVYLGREATLENFDLKKAFRKMQWDLNYCLEMASTLFPHVHELKERVLNKEIVLKEGPITLSEYKTTTLAILSQADVYFTLYPKPPDAAP